MNQSSPFRIPPYFGIVLITMGGIILGAALGLVPTDGGRFMAPEWIIYGLSICLISGGLSLWLPEKNTGHHQKSVSDYYAGFPGTGVQLVGFCPGTGL